MGNKLPIFNIKGRKRRWANPTPQLRDKAQRREEAGSSTQRNGSFGFKLFGKMIVDFSSGDLSVQAPLPTMCKDAIKSRKDDSSYTLFNEYEATMKIKRSSIEAEDAEKARAIRRGEETPIPCPRCSSLDTRFCYFNNYDVEQPRYFCKACQRFWTNGGSMRNLPVGSGRRKRRRKSGTGVKRVELVGGSRQGSSSRPFFMAATMILGDGVGFPAWNRETHDAAAPEVWTDSHFKKFKSY